MKGTRLYKAAVIIHALSSIAGIVQTFPLLLHGPNNPGNPAIPWIVVVLAALLSVVGILSAYGAWYGQKWGIWLTVVTEALNGLLALPGVLFAPTESLRISAITTVLIALFVIFALLYRPRTPNRV